MGSQIRGKVRCIDAHLRIGRILIRIVDPGKSLNQPCASFRIQPLAITRLADFDGCRDVYLDESSERVYQIADRASGCGVRRDRRTDRDPAILRNLTRHVTDTQNIEIAMLLRETEFAR